MATRHHLEVRLLRRHVVVTVADAVILLRVDDHLAGPKGRGVAGDYAVRRGDLVQLRYELDLHLQLLGNGFDDHPCVLRGFL